MSNEEFTITIRKFLKHLGVTGHQILEDEIREAVMFGKLISTDVIELFSKDDNNKIKRVGIAHIPDIKTSRMCNDHVSNSDLSLLRCKLDYRFKKWIPQEIYLDEIEVTNYDDINNMMINVISH